MRITFALPGLDGLAGGLRVAAQYAEYLSDQGHQVTLAVRRPGPAFSRRLAVKRFLGLARTVPLSEKRGHFTGLDLPIIQLDDHRPVRPENLPDADVIVSTWWTTAEWADGLPSRKGVHVHFIQDYEVFEPKLTSRVNRVYFQENKKIVISRWLADVMAEKYGQAATLVPNGVNIRNFYSPPRSWEKGLSIGFLYSSHPRKNVKLAISTSERLRAIFPDMGGISFGAKERPASLPDWIAYERQPSQDRIAAIYASCDLWLFTSVSEGFGLPLLEAMASRTPVIATAAGAAPDLVDGLNGRLAAADPEAFAREAISLLMDQTTWQAASDAAWATAQRHNLKAAGARFEAALLQAAGLQKEFSLPASVSAGTIMTEDAKAFPGVPKGATERAG